MRIWAVANQKGGVGKTTTAVSLAGLLAESGERTLMVDLDPHASLTGYFGFLPDQLQFSVYHLFKGQVDTASCREGVLETDIDNLSLLGAAPAMATLDRQLGSQPSMGLVVARGMESLAQDYDRVVLDCPPMLGVLMVNALAACEKLLIPTQTEFLALHGLERMVRSLEMIQKARKTSVPYVVVPTMYDKRTRASLDSLSMLQQRYPDHLSETVIPIDTQFREVSRLGEPLPLAQAGARGSKAYVKLLKELLDAEIDAQAELVS